MKHLRDPYIELLRRMIYESDSFSLTKANSSLIIEVDGKVFDSSIFPLDEGILEAYCYFNAAKWYGDNK